MNSRKVKVLYLGVGGGGKELRLPKRKLTVFEKACLPQSLRRCALESGCVSTFYQASLQSPGFTKQRPHFSLLKNFVPKERDSGPKMGGTLSLVPGFFSFSSHPPPLFLRQGFLCITGQPRTRTLFVDQADTISRTLLPLPCWAGIKGSAHRSVCAPPT